MAHPHGCDHAAAAPGRSGRLLRPAAALGATALAALLWAAVAAAQPLLSWNDAAAKTRILQFVQQAKDAVPQAERVAVFDNDGTLWSEQPLYNQLVFMLDQVKAAAPKHPEWKDDPVFKVLAGGDREALAKMGHKPVLKLVGQANSGMTIEAYDKSIRAWLESARHPRFKRPYTDLVYQPMQELLEHLREHGFKTYVVSGGSIEFMRPWAEKAYGIPPEQIVGSISRVRLEMKGGRPVLVREPAIDFVDDGPGKPVGIYRAIGRRPIAAFGNSDGDLQMLQWTMAGQGPRLAALVRHTDAAREYAYDRESRIGKLDKALDEANRAGWLVVDMKRDWTRVFAFD